MASGRTERVYHQDYIARIRYSNVLPPPPNPPKLLEIPNNAIEQYTSAAFASRMAREQPLNIEADAELGMPIDLIGIPGVFEGDEKALYGRDHPPPPHPHDKPLLKSLAVLQKGASSGSGVAFLRSTEFLSSEAARTRTDMSSLRTDARKRKRPEGPKEDDPVRMVRDIVKGFDIAYPEDIVKGQESVENVKGSAIGAEERKAWSNPKHPSNVRLELLDSYPVLPDLDGIPDGGPYMVAKFATNPVDAIDRYDARLDVAVFKPQITQQLQAEYESQKAAHEADPSIPAPEEQYEYEFFLPTASAVANIATKLDVDNPERDDDSLYTESQSHFTYDRVRGYETQQQQLSQNKENPYDDTIVVALQDKAPGLGKAALMYPVGSRVIIRPKRVKQPNPLSQPEEDEMVNRIELSVRDLSQEEREMVAAEQAKILGGTGAIGAAA